MATETNEKQRKEGFVNGDFLPTKNKTEILGQPIQVEKIKYVDVTNPQGQTQKVRVYETKEFSFFGSSIMDKAKEEDLIGKTVKVLKVKNYYAFAEA